MAGTSVTGRGSGESHGEHKPENQSCCCGGSGGIKSENIAASSSKRGCYVKQKSCQTLVSKNGRKNSWKGC